MHAALCLAWRPYKRPAPDCLLPRYPPRRLLTPACLPCLPCLPSPACLPACPAATTCLWASCAASSWLPCPGPPSASPTSWAAPARRMCASPSSSSECPPAAAWAPAQPCLPGERCTLRRPHSSCERPLTTVRTHPRPGCAPTPAPLHPCRNKPNINILSLSRVFLFGARDVWFEVPLPFFLRDAASGLGWSRSLTGAFLAVSGAGAAAAAAPCPPAVLRSSDLYRKCTAS